MPRKNPDWKMLIKNWNCRWDLANCGWDLTKWLERRLTVNAKVATVLGSIPASSRHSGIWWAAVEMKQCWITYIKKPPYKKKLNKSIPSQATWSTGRSMTTRLATLTSSPSTWTTSSSSIRGRSTSRAGWADSYAAKSAGFPRPMPSGWVGDTEIDTLE